MATTLPWFICDCPGFSTENLASQETLSAMSWKTPQLWANLRWWSGFPDSSVGKQSACNAGVPGSIPGLGRSPREGIGYSLQYSWASLVAQLVKNPPTMRETCVWSLGWEDPLEKKGKVTLVFWPGEFHGLYIHYGVAKSWTRLSDFHLSDLLSSEFTK